MARGSAGDLFSAPSADGTSSPARAKRYIDSGEAAPGAASPSRGARDSPKAAADGARARGAGGAAPPARRGRRLSGGGDEREQEEEEEIDVDFSATWNHFEPPEGYAKGDLRKAVRGGPASGMSHPPQNPAVQKDLMLHFQRHGVEGHAQRRPIRRPRQEQEKGQSSQGGRRRSSLGSSALSRNSPSGSRGTTPSVTGGTSSLLSLHPGGATGEGGGSAATTPKGARSNWTAGKWTLPWAPNDPIPGAGGDRGGAARRAQQRGGGAGGGNGNWGELTSAEMWAQFRRMHNKDHAVPPPVSFLEVQRWGKGLQNKSREHGFELSRRSVEDMGELSMYHNQITRSRSSPNAAAQSPELWASQTLKSLRTKQGDVEANISALEEELSPLRIEHHTRLMERKALRSKSVTTLKPPLEHSHEAVRGGSSEKMMHTAEAILRAGPTRLQFMADALGVSLTTGRAGHRDADDWLLGDSAVLGGGGGGGGDDEEFSGED